MRATDPVCSIRCRIGLGLGKRADWRWQYCQECEAFMKIRQYYPLGVILPGPRTLGLVHPLFQQKNYTRKVKKAMTARADVETVVDETYS